MAETGAWMPLWIGDYLADTMHLTTEQHGAYLLILMDYWRRGAPAADDRTLAAIAKISLAKWKICGAVLAPFFYVENGRWKHKRVEAERAKALENREKYSKRASTAAAARWNATSNATSNANGVLEQCPSPSPNIVANATTVVPASRRKTKSALPHKWLPKPFGDGTDCKAIIDDWSDDRFKSEVEGFRAHHGSRANVMADWQQAWATWVLNSKKFDRRTTNGAGNDRSGIDRTTAAAERAFGPAHEWTDDQPF